MSLLNFVLRVFSAGLSLSLAAGLLSPAQIQKNYLLDNNRLIPGVGYIPMDSGKRGVSPVKRIGLPPFRFARGIHHETLGGLYYVVPKLKSKRSIMERSPLGPDNQAGYYWDQCQFSPLTCLMNKRKRSLTAAQKDYRPLYALQHIGNFPSELLVKQEFDGSKVDPLNREHQRRQACDCEYSPLDCC